MHKKLKKKTQSSVFGSYKQGFSLLELIIILFVIGLTLSVAVPQIQYLFPVYKRRLFFAELSALTQLGWQQAIATQQLHRVVFDVKGQSIQLEREAGDNKPKQVFDIVSLPYVNTRIVWPNTMFIKQFFVGKKEYAARAGVDTEQMWFYISATGLAQPVTINWQISEEEDDVSMQGFSTVLNPFTARFKKYDQFQKP